MKGSNFKKMNILIYIVFLFNLYVQSDQKEYCYCAKKNPGALKCTRADLKYPLVVDVLYLRDCVVDLQTLVDVQLQLFELAHLSVTNLKSLDNFTNTTSLIITHANLDEITCTPELHNLKHLNLSYNRIDQLENNPLCLPVNLVCLDLSYNRIRSIDPFFFASLNQLKYLYMAGNSFKELALQFYFSFSFTAKFVFSHNPNLKNFNYLNITGVETNRNLVEFTLDNCSNLQKLPLIFTQHVDVRLEAQIFNGLFRLNYLKVANGSGSTLAIMKRDDSTALNQSLLLNFNVDPFNFNLSRNGFTQLPEIYSLDRIESLNLRENKLTRLVNDNTLPYSITSLDLCQNLIESIEENFFVPMKHLKNLLVDENRIRVIDRLVFTSEQLKFISISQNDLRTLNEIHLNTSRNVTINELRLTRNSLDKLPIFTGSIRMIKRLNLRSNLFHKLELNSNVSMLDLTYNNLSLQTVREMFGRLVEGVNVTVFLFPQLNDADLTCDRLRRVKLSSQIGTTIKLVNCSVTFRKYPTNNSQFAFNSSNADVEYDPWDESTSKEDTYISHANKFSIFEFLHQRITFVLTFIFSMLFLVALIFFVYHYRDSLL